MKTSWIIAIVMAYLLIFALEVFVTGGLTFASTSSGVDNIASSNQSALSTPDIAESSNVFTAAWAVVKGVASYLKILIGMLFLWMPTVFTGYLVWFWWFVCFPVDVGMVFSIVSIVRGVHSA